MTHTPVIVFVYNADSGVFNLMADIAHKILSPSTYGCNLCDLTHATFGQRKEWKEVLSSLPFESEFLHADEFRARHHDRDHTLPAIFLRSGSEWLSLVDASTINECRSLDDLRHVITKGLERLEPDAQ